MRSRLFVYLLLLSTLPALPLWAQQPGVTTRYVYDANGRLRAVITPEGAAIYEYDAAGNFTRIRRLNPNDCEALEFTPQQAPFGALVTLYGVGMTGATAVTFNGSGAEIVSKSPTSLVVKVPDTAQTGTLEVNLPCGRKTFAAPFTVSGIRVAPAAITLAPHRQIQFAAVVAGITDSSVVWSVGNIPGGNETVGTISESGFYLAPMQDPSTNMTYLVRATSVVQPELFGEAQVRIVGSGYEFLARGVAVRYGPPPGQAPTFARASVTARYGSRPSTALAYVTQTVTVRYGPAGNEKPTALRGFVSARYGAKPTTDQSYVQARVSVTRGPVISAVAPNAAIKRGTTFTLTVTGNGLSGVQALEFFQAVTGLLESNITVTGISSNANGTSLTATITIAANTPPNRYFLRVTTTNGQTILAATGTNTLEIVQ